MHGLIGIMYISERMDWLGSFGPWRDDLTHPL